MAAWEYGTAIESAISCLVVLTPSSRPASRMAVRSAMSVLSEQPDADAVKAQMTHVLNAMEARFPKAAAHLDTAQHDLPAFTAFPRGIWRQTWSNNPQERLPSTTRNPRSEA